MTTRKTVSKQPPRYGIVLRYQQFFLPRHSRYPSYLSYAVCRNNYIHLLYGIGEWEWPNEHRLAVADVIGNLTGSLESCHRDAGCVPDTLERLLKLGGNRRIRRSPKNKKGSSPKMPVVFVPEASETECIPKYRMSSWGFMSFILATVNAVISQANNVDNNNNNRLYDH